MKRVLFGTLAGTILLGVAGAWGAGENWKLLSTDEKTNQKYYYDTTSVKKGKGGRVTVTTKTESGTGPAQKWQMEVDCGKSRYRFINPNHEWAPAEHGTPAGVLQFRVCK